MEVFILKLTYSMKSTFNRCNQYTLISGTGNARMDVESLFSHSWFSDMTFPGNRKCLQGTLRRLWVILLCYHLQTYLFNAYYFIRVYILDASGTCQQILWAFKITWSKEINLFRRSTCDPNIQIQQPGNVLWLYLTFPTSFTMANLERNL